MIVRLEVVVFSVGTVDDLFDFVAGVVEDEDGWGETPMARANERTNERTRVSVRKCARRSSKTTKREKRKRLTV